MSRVIKTEKAEAAPGGWPLRLPASFSWNLAGWSLDAGLRAGLACCVPLLLAEWLALPGLSWAGIAGFWGCLVDPGGPPRTRRLTLSVFALGAVSGCFLAVLVRPHLWLSGAFALAWCLAATFARVWGNAAAGAGTLLAVVVLVVLGLDQPSSLGDAAALAGLTLAGVLWAMLLALVVWRQHPYAPARAALAAVFRAAAAYARVIPGPPLSHDQSDLLSRISHQRRRGLREAIEAARAVLVSTQRDRTGQSMRGRHLILMLADADRAFSAMIAADELLEGMSALPPAQDKAIRAALACLAAKMDGIATQLQAPAGADQPASPPSESFAADDQSLRYVADLLQTAESWINAAAEHLGGVSVPGRLPEPAPLEATVSLAGQIRNNLTPSSLALRHAARFAVTGTVLVLMTNGLHVERGYWITITAVAVLQVYPSATWQRAVERVGGSVLGGLIAVGAAFVLHGPAETTLLILPLSVLTMAVRGVSYALFTLFLTPEFVLVAELFQTGGNLTPHLGDLRAIDSVVGSLIGLLANFTLWPSWESRYLRQRLAEAVRCNGAFLLAALDLRMGRLGPDAVEQTRRNAGLASNNAEGSVQRVLGEPRRQAERQIAAAMTITAASRRLAGVAAAIAQVGPELPLPSELLATRNALEAQLNEIAETINRGVRPAATPARLAGPIGEGVMETELHRAWRQLSVLHGAADRLASDRTSGFD